MLLQSEGFELQAEEERSGGMGETLANDSKSQAFPFSLEHTLVNIEAMGS